MLAGVEPVSSRYSSPGITLTVSCADVGPLHLRSREVHQRWIHQPDQADFRSVLPEDIDWKPFPAFPPSVRLAIVVGEPSEPGPYVIRVKCPRGSS